MIRQKIEYREYKRQDKKELIKILTEQIYSNFFEKEKDAEKYSGFVLKKAIGCKYKKAVVVGDRVVGALFGVKKERNRLLSLFIQKICHAQLMIRKKNREALKYLLLLDEMEQELLIQNHVDNESRIVLLVVEKRYERAEIQETLLKEWGSMIREQKNRDFCIVVNGRSEPGFLDKFHFQKIDEKSAMIQPKELRFRFYKTLYRERM